MNQGEYTGGPGFGNPTSTEDRATCRKALKGTCRGLSCSAAADARRNEAPDFFRCSMSGNPGR